MEDDQRLNTLVHEGDTLHFLPQKPTHTVANMYFTICAISYVFFLEVDVGYL